MTITLEIEGWTAEGEYVSAIILGRNGESEDDLITRGKKEEGIVEVGTIKVF